MSDDGAQDEISRCGNAGGRTDRIRSKLIHEPYKVVPLGDSPAQLAHFPANGCGDRNVRHGACAEQRQYEPMKQRCTRCAPDGRAVDRSVDGHDEGEGREGEEAFGKENLLDELIMYILLVDSP